MFNLSEKSEKQELQIPEALYHATYKPLWNGTKKTPGIKTIGLGGTTRKNWEDSVPGVIYLSEDPYVAESYAESAEEDFVKDSWIENIVILKVNTVGLPKENFFIDANNQAGDTIEYHGVIPTQNISLFKME